MVVSNTNCSMTESRSAFFANTPEGPGSRTGTASLPRIGKALGTLALLLSSGQSAGAAKVNDGSRRLLEGHGHSEFTPEPFDYDSLCKSGIIQAHVDGLTQEACLEQEQEKIDAIRDTKPLKKLKDCYSISGYLSAALTGASVLSAIADSPILASGAIGSALVALVPTAVCGGMSNHIKGRLHDSRQAAEKCCKYFVSEAKLAQNSSASSGT